MTTWAGNAERPRIVTPADGEVLGPPDGSTDRIIGPTEEATGHFSLVEHRLAPRALAAPLHLHTREDEWSYVLAGRVGALCGDEEIVAEVGDLVRKPRGEWHTFWNAGDEPARVLEVIAPGGLERLFRELASFEGELDPETLSGFAERYGSSVDFERTGSIIERHALRF